MWEVPDPRKFDSLLEMLDDAAIRWGGRRQFALRTDDGIELPWSARDLQYRSKLAAWRIRRLGLQEGDRLLTWSPATPALPAVYYGAMRAGVIIVPLDLRMAPDVVRRIAEKADTEWLVVGSGYDAPDPNEARLDHFTIRTVEWLVSDPAHQSASLLDEGGLDDPLPEDWEKQVDGWPKPTRDSLFEVIYTSGTTGMPKGVMLKHGTILSTMEAIGHLLPPREHRTVSLLPPSHLFDQGPIMFYGMMIGADILYVRSRNPRVIFDALREHRVTTMVVVPQMLDLFWAGLQREIKRQGRERVFKMGLRMAPFLPYWARRMLFRPLHEQLGGALNLFASAGAYLPPAVQKQWENLGIVVIQGYGATECGPISATTEQDHPVGSVGKTLPPVEVRLDEKTSEILVRGPTVFPGYWKDPDATAAVMSGEWYRTGDVGHHDKRGNLVLSGRTKNIIVLPNGFNVFPEDIENVLQEVGLAQAVVLETERGRIEAVVLSPDAPAMITASSRAPEPPSTPEEVAVLRARIEPLIKQANARLGQQQRLSDFRLWPEADFPRTHTLKIRRAEVQKWAGGDVPLALRETAD